MNRRSFLQTTSAAALALAAQSAPTQSASAQTTTPTPPRQFFELRRYLLTGNQPGKVEAYFRDALLPALNRLGIAPIGAFRLDIGPETPTFILLHPSPSLPQLLSTEAQLAADPTFAQAAAPFWSAPATTPPFVRISSELLQAFSGYPQLTPPPKPSTPTTTRIFQLRTYESPTPATHLRKIEMFHSGEFDAFHRAGFDQVFYGDTLIGPRLPSLTYMLSMNSLADLDAHWRAFGGDPGWQKLSHDPHFATDPLVSNITNLVLHPLACSQI